ncbi:TPM domain-containing protein [Leptospira wolffii]|uniref:TPM domain-containing protein n=1 Tax=Leptospira wolffii TaxID=409998 RepID=A0ABV5BQT1_9LEPT|nr:YgcG family protein [Leptospira wolffii]EPG67516.1 PF04536 family protein [Leptospira wolffii serovar Khorat str. Khorat-H2]TGL45411.1 YgcG family protein [Leptospira wolffii]
MKRIFLPLLCLCIGPLFADPLPLPTLEHRVTDLTGTLTSEQTDALESKLKAFEKRKGSQVVIVMIPTTGEEPIEDYSIRLADEWKIGRKKIDDGFIFLIAKNDRKMRFEVGTGLEGAVTDFSSKRIQTEFVRPLFKEGKYFEGIETGIDKVIGLIDGEPLPEPETHTGYESSEEEDNFGLYIGALVVIGILAGIFLRKMFSILQAGAATYAGYWFGGILGFSLETMLPLLVIFFVLLCIIYIAAKSAGSGGSGDGSSGGWSSWSSGSDWGSSSSSSDSFSGGGGGFSGGGSSSDW